MYILQTNYGGLSVHKQIYLAESATVLKEISHLRA